MTLYQIASSGVYQEAVTIDPGLDELSKDITSLSVYTTYCIRLAGRTRIGPGNWSDCFNVTTDDEGKELVTETKRVCIDFGPKVNLGTIKFKYSGLKGKRNSNSKVEA